jgi:hypothetical protein
MSISDSTNLSYFVLSKLVTDVERLRRPIQKITNYILRKAGVKEKAGVVDLNSRRIVTR